MKLSNALFASCSLDIKATGALTNVTIDASFDQIVAEQLGVKNHIYNGEDEGALKTCGIEWEENGARIVFLAEQSTIDGKVKIDDKGFQITTLVVEKFRVRKHVKDGSLKAMFDFTCEDDDGALDQFIKGIKRDPMKVTIEPVNKQESEAAKAQLKMFSGRPNKNGDDDVKEAQDAEPAEVDEG